MASARGRTIAAYMPGYPSCLKYQMDWPYKNNPGNPGPGKDIDLTAGRGRLLGPGKEVRDTISDWVCHAAPGTRKSSPDNPCFILFLHAEFKVPLADRTAEYVKQASFHGFFRISIICETSGPVDIRVIGTPISASAFSRNARAFCVS